MAQAVKIFYFFAIVMVVLHYIGPASQFVLERTPSVINFLANTGMFVWPH